MRHPIRISLLPLAGLALLAGPAVHAQPARKSPASPSAAAVKQLMEAIESASNVVYQAAAEAPESDEDWSKVGQNAVKLAEAGKLLTTSAYARGRKADWIKWSRAFIAASMKAADAAKKKSLDVLPVIGDDINISCEACHARYLESPGSLKPPR